MADFTVTNHGSIILVKPLSEAAKAWLAENVSDEALWHFNGALAVEPRFIEDLLDGMLDAGLEG
jgi:hypothetical protein